MVFAVQFARGADGGQQIRAAARPKFIPPTEVLADSKSFPLGENWGQSKSPHAFFRSGKVHQLFRRSLSKAMVAAISTLFTLSTIAFGVLFDFGDGATHGRDLELIFKGRTKSQWEDAWHREKFIRCRETLVSHLYWACEKDIYRITRRNQKRNQEVEQKQLELWIYPWISEETAKTYLRTKRSYGRRSGSSITAECCRSSGCTWEEYAEYCPINKRYV